MAGPKREQQQDAKVEGGQHPLPEGQGESAGRRKVIAALKKTGRYYRTHKSIRPGKLPLQNFYERRGNTQFFQRTVKPKNQNFVSG